MVGPLSHVPSQLVFDAIDVSCSVCVQWWTVVSHKHLSLVLGVETPSPLAQTSCFPAQLVICYLALAPVTAKPTVAGLEHLQAAAVSICFRTVAHAHRNLFLLLLLISILSSYSLLSMTMDRSPQLLPLYLLCCEVVF